MNTAEKIFGAVAATLVGGLIAIILYCVFWLHSEVESRDKTIYKQDSTIIELQSQIETLQHEKDNSGVSARKLPKNKRANNISDK
jgi:uncharacterized membrane protein required for colicin V production